MLSHWFFVLNLFIILTTTDNVSMAIEEIQNTHLYSGVSQVFEKSCSYVVQDGLLYKLKEPSKAINIRGDQEEKIVFKIIETSGNLGRY